MDRVNHAIFEKEVWPYLTDTLEPVEDLLFRRLQREVGGEPILDMGVGAGRTTPHLLQVSSNYIGADYSNAMVGAARRKFQGVEIVKLDARDLSCFEPDRFGAVVFSYNGIDYVPHDDRLHILAEVHRVLRPGGIFLFSSHNLRCNAGRADIPVWRKVELPELPRTRRHFARRMAWFGLSLGRRVVNHLRLVRHESRFPDHAILNDSGHDYGLLTYYVTLAEQREQLRGVGFAADVEVFERSGSPAMPESTEIWLHYLAHKPPG